MGLGENWINPDGKDVLLDIYLEKVTLNKAKNWPVFVRFGRMWKIPVVKKTKNFEIVNRFLSSQSQFMMASATLGHCYFCNFSCFILIRNLKSQSCKYIILILLCLYDSKVRFWLENEKVWGGDVKINKEPFFQFITASQILGFFF